MSLIGPPAGSVRIRTHFPFHGVYQDKEWAAALARESDSRGQVYHQYLTWVSRPQKGKFVNLDPDNGPQDLEPAAS